MDDDVIDKFGSYYGNEIIRSAKERGGGTKGYAEAILSV